MAKPDSVSILDYCAIGMIYYQLNYLQSNNVTRYHVNVFNIGFYYVRLSILTSRSIDQLRRR